MSAGVFHRFPDGKREVRVMSDHDLDRWIAEWIEISRAHDARCLDIIDNELPSARGEVK